MRHDSDHERESSGAGPTLAGRRVYHVSLGMMEAGLYGIPLAFVCGVFLAGLPSYLALALGISVWAGVWIWMMRRAEGRFRASSSRAVAGISGGPDRMQKTVLRYAALAGCVLLAFVLVPALLSVAGLPLYIGVWIPVGGFGSFSFLILLAAATLYSILGLVDRLRSALYPEYPAFVAALLLDLAILAFFLTSVLAS